MKIYTLIVAAGLLAACNNAPKSTSDPKAAEKQNDNKLPNDQAKEDAEFLVKVADGNMLEIELGKLAMTHGKSAKVTGFGKMMADHHSKMLNGLKSLASSKNITMPAELCDDSKDKVTDLTKEQGKDFDEDYIDEMVSDHKKDIKAFEDKLKDEDCDPDLRKLLNESLPILHDHLNAITEIKDSQK